MIVGSDRYSQALKRTTYNTRMPMSMGLDFELASVANTAMVKKTLISERT